MQATLVSVYGFEKSEEFVDLIAQCQRKVGDLLDGKFKSYPLEQVHATIIGLEGKVFDDKLLNDNFRDKKREPTPEDREMDLDQVLEVWRSATPFTIQLGAWKKDTDYSFHNYMNESPYEGSFFIRNNLVGAMGWPAELGDHGATLTRALFTLRKAFETKANALHRWHRKPGEDNDFFFRLGQTCLPDDHQLVDDARREMRDHMASLEPLYLELNPKKWIVVAYTDNKLPWEQKADNRRSQSDVTSQWLRAVYFQ